MKKEWTTPTVEKIEFNYADVVAASGGGHGNGSNNGRWGDGNPNSHNSGDGIGAWHGGKNHDNFPEGNP